ncbi:Uncharacterized protein Tcan_15846 [Toxocara canis]|uniref:NADAR domain-containing protein n=1 Tax=Toxocara canis TaxID=6265 RepID=A0A0B2V001_TOXCA|nr:Uncharacterized protein Tcan_15846 [Toxocara canis]
MTNLVTAPSGAKFTLFFSIRSPFSNFHPCRMTITDEGTDGTKNSHFFNCTEQYYMYHKALSSGDLETANEIMKEREARKIKMLGKNVKNFDQNKWDSLSEDVMWRGNIAKYTQNDDLRKKLFCTHGSILVECSPTDAIWGIGMDIHEPDAVDPAKWRGQNKLGHILTRIREHLWEQPEYAEEPPKPRSISRPSFASPLSSSNSILTPEGQQLSTKQLGWVGIPISRAVPINKRSRSPDEDRAASFSNSHLLLSPAAKKFCADNDRPVSTNGSITLQGENSVTEYWRRRQSSSRDEGLMEAEGRSACRYERSTTTRRERHTRDGSNRSQRERRRRHRRRRLFFEDRGGRSGVVELVAVVRQLAGYPAFLIEWKFLVVISSNVLSKTTYVAYIVCSQPRIPFFFQL